MRTWIVALALGSIALAADEAAAHAYTLQECFEAGDFIVNAAKARDNGMRREAFLGKLVDDIALIRAFPPELRWFVADAADAEFLHAESARVFDEPATPETHRAQFLARCFDRMGSAN